MTLRLQLESIISERHLLKHPFYIAWTQGKLTRAHLKQYAEQYFHHVLAFPTYVSAVHFNTPHLDGDISIRQEILENLISEERGEKNHPALWKNFAVALGSSETELKTTKQLESTENLVNIFRQLCIQSPFYVGLAVLYVYESQIPEVAAVKIDGLQQFYGMNDAKDYEFFTVHQTADIYHAQSELQLIETYAGTEDQVNDVVKAAQTAADALWQFLDGIYQNYCQDIQLEQETSITPVMV